MMKQRLCVVLLMALVCMGAVGKKKVTKQELWPNGEPMS